MRLALIPLVLLALSGCVAPEAEQPPYWWKLVSINGKPFPADVQMAFRGEDGKELIGQGPCNSFAAKVVTRPSPTVRFVNITSTERACAQLSDEVAFFQALGQVTGEGVGVGFLYLVNDKGLRMDFVPGPGPATPPPEAE
ncbi:META domain-containing protein [Neotabrizicola shimadae]|uniref:META domain-containing protein n=1 Tax=Neotabrizicola shimadae TaxID=2807096 RepID=A0A8G0ZQN8_9RHOB|nr:META domain-containing protein [Neotabrizicola shimadae]QYZ69691.1 META domain-containing protein [Neotabrizicola shimadae]